MMSEVNLSDNYRKDLIEALARFSKYNDNKPLKNLTRTNIIAFLETLRKTETQDPMHKWIGTYNIFRIYLLRFFKWLYYPDIEPEKRPKPSVIENIARLKRKEKSIYKPSDPYILPRCKDDTSKSELNKEIESTITREDTESIFVNSSIISMFQP
jgi:hypothetical protein